MRAIDAGALATFGAPSGLRPTVQDDRALMACVAAGDREALGTLYNLFASVMMAVAVRMLGGQREAQDLVHDVFLEAWLHAGEFDAARGSLRSWLLLRLRSRALDRLGRAEAQRTSSIETSHPAEPQDPIAPALEQADRIGLREAVERLDGGVREILELTYFRGMTADAVARSTGLPVGTVRSRLARGLRVLRATLRPSEPEATR
jgi:RNA polymerase sigma-70 factor (ECF subfamily)